MKLFILNLWIGGALLVAVSLASCSKSSKDYEARMSPACPVISKETAVLIAKGALQTSYNESRFNIDVGEDGENWIVKFQTKCSACNDGNPYALVKKSSGEVVQVFPYGEPMK